MEKLDLNVKLEGTKDVLKKTEEAVKAFFASLWTEELKANNPEMDAKELDKLIKNHVKAESEKLIVDTSSIDPRIVYLDTYCVLTQSALDILSSMGEEYVTVEKENIKVKGLKKHKKIVSDIYHITLKEDSNDYKGGVHIHVALNTTPGAYDFIKLAFLEDEIYYTKACLDAYDVKF